MKIPEFYEFYIIILEKLKVVINSVESYLLLFNTLIYKSTDGTNINIVEDKLILNKIQNDVSKRLQYNIYKENDYVCYKENYKKNIIIIYVPESLASVLFNYTPILTSLPLDVIIDICGHYIAGNIYFSNFSKIYSYSNDYLSVYINSEKIIIEFTHQKAKYTYVAKEDEEVIMKSEGVSKSYITFEIFQKLLINLYE